MLVWGMQWLVLMKQNIKNMRNSILPDRIPVIYQNQMPDIKYLLRIMANLKILVLLVELTVIPALCALSSINPANYIWIDYQNQIPVSYKGSSTYTTSLPCAARIGKCSYNFAVLPPGWSATKDGTLTIPPSDATKSGTFSVQGEFSELTGEKINADLIIKIENGLLSAIDKADYYKKNGYNFQPEGTPMKTTQYEDGFLVKNLPDGFTPVTQLEKKIVEGDISNITSLINQTLNQYAPCRSMINYLTEVKGMLNKLITNNNDQIKAFNSTIKQMQTNIKNLLDKKQAELAKQATTTEVVGIKKVIDNLSAEIVKLRFNESISKDQAQKNIDVLNQYPINVETISSPELKDTISEIVKTSRSLESTYNDQIKIKKSILEYRLKKQVKGVPANFSAPIEAAYNKNSQAIVNAQIYLINNGVKSSNAEFLQADTNGYISAVNKKLDEMNTPPSIDYDTIKLIQTENLLLNKNIDYLTTIGRYAQQSCK